MEEFLELVKKGYLRKKTYDSREEYLSDTAGMLEREGLVKAGFKKVRMDREEQYPTGIKTLTLPVSIPHAEFSYVNRESIVVTVFEKPVAFRRMDAPDEEVEAEVSFMLLLRDAHSHLTVLQQLSGLLQSDRLEQIKKADSVETLAKILQEG